MVLLHSHVFNLFQLQNFTNQGETDAARCDTKEKLKERGCLETDIISPQNYLQSLTNKPLSGTVKGDPVQIQPQAVKLDLRPGTFFPMDMYTYNFCVLLSFKTTPKCDKLGYI